MTNAARPHGRTRPRWLLKAAIAAAALVVASPLALWAWGKAKRVVAAKSHAWLNVGQGVYYAGHDLLGYSLAPGVHYIGFEIGGERGGKFLLVGKDGCKTTSMKLLDDDRRPQWWMAGCSFVAGDTLSNQETFAWILQEELPEVRVRNLGCSSYGSIQALLRLREGRAAGALPRLFVFCHADWHRERNVASSPWLHSFRSPGPFGEEGGRRFVQAWLDGDRLAVRYVPYGDDRPEWAAALAAPPVGHAECLRVEAAIFREMHAICSEQGVRAVVAVISSQIHPETLASPTVALIRELGFEVIDISLPAGTPELDARYQQVPGSDVHPTAAGHRLYAERLLGYLRP